MCRISHNNSVDTSLLHSLMKHIVKIAYCFGRQTTFAVSSAILKLLVVEVLNYSRSNLLYRNITQNRDYMVVDVTLIAYVGGGSYAYGSVVLEPLYKPVFKQKSVRSNIGTRLFVVKDSVEFFDYFFSCFAIDRTLNLSAFFVTTIGISTLWTIVKKVDKKCEENQIEMSSA